MQVTTRQIFTTVAMLFFSAAFAITPSAAGVPEPDEPAARVPPLSRVRSNHAAIAAVMAAAAQRSPVFRRLVETIDASDGLVYVDEGNCGHGVTACLSLEVRVAGPYRLVRILVDPRKKSGGCELMASIGHELRHAVELLREPGVRDFHAAFSLFAREGRANSDSGRFETEAAVRTGLAVDREACGKP
jgi:hypothetical protein